MTLKRFISILFLLLPLSSIAGTPVYIKIQNKTNEDAVISAAGDSLNWRCGDLCSAQVVKANSSAKFFTETTAFNFFKLPHGIQTFNIAYGATSAKAQVWITKKHDVDINVKTTIFYVEDHSDWKYVVSVDTHRIGVGVDNEKIMTDLYVDDDTGYSKTAYITLILV